MINILIRKLAGPSGQHCRCYGVVDVSARSVFWCSQCTGEVDIWGPSGIVARRHLCDCAKTLTILKYRPCQIIVCAETLTVPNHWHHHNIDYAKTLTVPNHWQRQNIDRAKTSTVPKHQPRQNIVHAKNLVNTSPMQNWTDPKCHLVSTKVIFYTVVFFSSSRQILWAIIC